MQGLGAGLTRNPDHPLCAAQGPRNGLVCSIFQCTHLVLTDLAYTCAQHLPVSCLAVERGRCRAGPPVAARPSAAHAPVPSASCLPASPVRRSITGAVSMSTAAQRLGSGFNKQYQMTLLMGAIELAASQARRAACPGSQLSALPLCAGGSVLTATPCPLAPACLRAVACLVD